VLRTASGINDDGWIIGTAYNTLTGGQEHAYLLSVATIPEPETYAMMLAGLGLLGLTARRRKQKLNA
jgi:probable HAF family extracellular repeat protein